MGLVVCTSSVCSVLVDFSQRLISRVPSPLTGVQHLRKVTTTMMMMRALKFLTIKMTSSLMTGVICAMILQVGAIAMLAVDIAYVSAA